VNRISFTDTVTKEQFFLYCFKIKYYIIVLYYQVSIKVPILFTFGFCT